MTKPAAATAQTPKPDPDPRDVCTTCGKPIDLLDHVWIAMGAGVDAGVEHDRCR